MIFLVALGAPRLHAQELVLERYDVTATPLVAGGAGGVPGATVRSHRPVDVGALLAREVPAIAPIRRGGVATDLLLRGLGRDNVTVTLDGAPAYCACPGRMDPPVFHVSTPLVERIAVHAGPFDVRTGGAPGGAITVESAPPPEQLAAMASGTVGSDDLRAADATVGGSLGGGWRGLLAASWQQARSYRDGDGRRATELPGLNFRPERQDDIAFRIAHAEAHARWAEREGGELALRVAVNDARDVFYPALLMDAQRDRSVRLGAGWRGTSRSALAAQWRADVYHHRVEHDMSDAFRSSSLWAWAARGYMMRTQATATNFGANFEADGSAGATTLVWGMQLTARNWTADNVVGPNANRMLPDVTVSQAGGFVQAERQVGRWKLQAGARADAWHSRAARDLTFLQQAQGTARNARTDVAPTGHVIVERAWAGGAVFGGIGAGARLPDPQERYLNMNRPGVGTDWVGNPRLDVVRSTEAMLGARLRVGTARVALRVFHSWLEDYVVLGRLIPAAGSPANPLRTESYFGIGADLTGAELLAELPLGGGWTAAAGAAGQEGRKRSFGPGDTDRDLPEMPPWRGRAALRWTRETSWLEIEGQWAARQTHLDASAGEKPVAGFGVLHLRAERMLGRRFTVGVGVENVFDRTYATHNAYTRDPFAAGLVLNEPGRIAYVKLRWEL